MATNRLTYRLVVRESPLRERYDALLATLQDLHFEVEPEGRDLCLTPSPEGLQLLIERRTEFEATLAAYDDIIMEYPFIQTVVMPFEEEGAG
jgi:hypothetical protein